MSKAVNWFDRMHTHDYRAWVLTGCMTKMHQNLMGISGEEAGVVKFVLHCKKCYQL